MKSLKNMSFYSKLFLSLVVVIVIYLIYAIYLIIHLFTYEKTYVMHPSSPKGVTFISKTSSFKTSFSKIYVKYPTSNTLVYTGLEIIEDDGSALSTDKADYKITWLDGNKAQITFKGRGYKAPSVNIVEY